MDIDFEEKCLKQRTVVQKPAVTAKMLSDMFTLRQNIGYRLTLIYSEESKQEAEKTMQELVLPFLQEIDKLINLKS